MNATRRALGILTAGLALPLPALGQWAPRQPIRILVGFSPGGTADITARMAQDALQRRSGTQVVVENRTGALGYIALQAAARATPDGTTLAIGILGNMVMGPIVPGTPIPFDLDAEILPICNLAGTPMALIARPDAPFSTLAEFVTWARERPGQATYASTGAGSTNQLAAEYLAREAGLRLLHVPYRGGAPAGMDLIAGRVDIFFGNIAEFAQMIRDRQVKALGLASSRPNAMVPDLPLLTRDYPALDIANWFGLTGPKALPADIAAALGQMFTDAMNDPATVAAMAPRGLEPIREVGPAFAERIRRDRERWGAVVRAANIRAN